MKLLLLSLTLALLNIQPASADQSRFYGGGYCSAVASKFQQDLRSCWQSNSQGCVKYYTRKDVMSDRDFHTCKYDLYTTCVSTCYSVWGTNDTACNNACAIIGKYLN